MRKILIYIYDGMASFEITLLTQLLSLEQGFELVIAADELRLIKDKPGFSIMPQVELKNIKGNEIEGIIIPGGWLAHLDEQLISLLRELDEEHKLIAAICAAPWILAKAGLLTNRRYTSSIVKWEDRHKEVFGLVDPFPRESYEESRVVRDDHIITAKGTAFIDFTIEVCSYLGIFDDYAEKIAFEQELKGC